MSVQHDRALALARHEHRDDIAWTGEPMIEHITRVTRAVAGDELTQLLALMHHLPHGAVENGSFDLTFGGRLAKALLIITDREQVERSYWYAMGATDDSHVRVVTAACLDDYLGWHPADEMQLRDPAHKPSPAEFARMVTMRDIYRAGEDSRTEQP